MGGPRFGEGRRALAFQFLLFACLTGGLQVRMWHGGHEKSWRSEARRGGGAGRRRGAEAGRGAARRGGAGRQGKAGQGEPVTRGEVEWANRMSMLVAFKFARAGPTLRARLLCLRPACAQRRLSRQDAHGPCYASTDPPGCCPFQDSEWSSAHGPSQGGCPKKLIFVPFRTWWPAMYRRRRGRPTADGDPAVGIPKAPTTREIRKHARIATRGRPMVLRWPRTTS